jgi:phytoene dehydrogenase-like protein
MAALRPTTLRAAPYLFSTVAQLARSTPAFKTFLDAQLLIAAQAVSDNTQAVYGSAALDLPRRGVSQVHGGIGTLAKTLADWIKVNGGEVLYRQRVTQVEVKRGRVVAVLTDKGRRVVCEGLVANLTPWALAELLGEAAPVGLKQEARTRPPTWGAFTLYLGLTEAGLPANWPDHHQVVVDPTRPLGEGNSVFISLSPASDARRAPPGMRAATLSTHTAIAPWWAAERQGAAAYAELKALYTERLLRAAEHALPGLRSSIKLSLPGTPLTFEYYTGRAGGMVGGFPQTSLFKVRGPGTGVANLWLVGDSIFPGQSTAGATLGGMRVAAAVQARLQPPRFTRRWPETILSQR